MNEVKACLKALLKYNATIVNFFLTFSLLIYRK